MKNLITPTMAALVLSLGTAMVAEAKSYLGTITVREANMQVVIDEAAGIGRITLPVDVTRTGQGVLKVGLALVADLPEGSTAVFTPNPIVFKGNKPNTKTSDLTLTVPLTAIGGTYTYTIFATNGVTRKVSQFTGSITLPSHIWSPRAATLKIRSAEAAQASGNAATAGASIPEVLLNGTPGWTYVIQATSDLTNPTWSEIGTVTADYKGDCAIVDTDAANHSTRFYRAMAK